MRPYTQRFGGSYPFEDIQKIREHLLSHVMIVSLYLRSQEWKWRMFGKTRFGIISTVGFLLNDNSNLCKAVYNKR